MSCLSIVGLNSRVWNPIQKVLSCACIFQGIVVYAVSELQVSSLIHLELVFGLGIDTSLIIFPAPFVDHTAFSSVCTFVKYWMTEVCALLFASSILSHWTTCLFSCLHNAVLIMTALYYHLKYGKVTLTPYSFSIQCLLRFHTNLRKVFFLFLWRNHGNILKNQNCIESQNYFW